ncbi:MAG TPA: glycosyltransferase [Solirubrobacteraceae bacterium]|nr:glycosyltransferase [Solirubrobacteraceae bacterium]
MSATAVSAAPDTPRGSAASGPKRRRPAWTDDWPHTTRLMPWMIAVFMATVFLIPIDGTEFDVKLPVDSLPDRFLLVGMALVLLIQSLVTPKVRRPVVRMNGATGAVLLFAAVGLASVLPNVSRIFQLGELSLVEKQLSQLIGYVGFFLIVATQVRRSEIRAYGRFVLILAVLTSLGVLYESRTGYNVFYDWTRSVLGPIAHVIQAPTNIHPSVDEGRKIVVGPTQHGLALASMLTVAMPFAVIRLFEVKRWTARAAYLVAVGLIFAASLSTARKTAIIAPIGAIAVLAFYYRRMLKWLPVAIIVLLPVIHVASPGALGTFSILQTGGSSISTQGRESDYAAVKPDILANPILGRGYGSLDPDNPRWYRVLDNEYLGVLFVAGFLGAAAYLAMVLAPMFTAHRVIRRDPRRAPPIVAAAAGCAAYAIVSATFDAMSFPQAPYSFLFSAGLIAAAASRQIADRTVAIPPLSDDDVLVSHPRRRPDIGRVVTGIREQLVPGPLALAVVARDQLVAGARALVAGLRALATVSLTLAAIVGDRLLAGVRAVAIGTVALATWLRRRAVMAVRALVAGARAVAAGVRTGVTTVRNGLLAGLRAVALAVVAVAVGTRDVVVGGAARAAAGAHAVTNATRRTAKRTRGIATSSRGRAAAGLRRRPHGPHRPEPAAAEVDRPDLSVIVVTHNGREMALATLQSAMHAATGLDVEWIVVDSGSEDGTPDAVRQAHPDVVVIEADNRGCAAGNNVGLGVARGRYVLLLNPDVEIAQGTLKGLVVAMDERPKVAVASVVQRGTDGELQPSIRRFPSVRRDLGEALGAYRWPLMRTWQELETRPKVYSRETSADWLVGAFLIVRTEAIAQVGPMDEDFFLYSEEVDWCYRFTQQGWGVHHLPVMTIVHHAGRRDRGDLMAQLAHSRRLFAAKHYGAGRCTAIRTALALGHVIRILVLSPRSHDPEVSARIRAERRALAVQLGLAGPPALGAGHADDPPEPTVLVDAVHVFGVEALKPGDRDIELRIADVGIDVRRRSTGETIGRMHWSEVRTVAVQRPRPAAPGRQPTLFVAGDDRGGMTFELLGVSEDEITDQLEPLIARNFAGYPDSNAD